MGSIKIACVDIGTTDLKVVIKQNEQYSMETYLHNDLNDIVSKLIDDQYIDQILITGSGARYLEDSSKYIRADELECTANIMRYMNIERGLVVNMGTGTSFIQYRNGEYQHINGTGIGGGTFSGLGKRMLGTSNTKEIEELALHGELRKVNIVIEDIYKNGLGWLQNDITVSNFGKMTGDRQDIAIGIHSLIAEPIMSMINAANSNNTVEHVVFSGGVLNNILIRKLIIKYAEVFDLNCVFADNPSYGTCCGAIAWYESIYKNQ